MILRKVYASGGSGKKHNSKPFEDNNPGYYAQPSNRTKKNNGLTKNEYIQALKEASNSERAKLGNASKTTNSR